MDGYIKINKFNFNDMVEHSSILIIGKRRTGKSFLERDILYHKRNISSGIVVSPTEKVNPFYKDFISECYIYNKFSNEILDSVFKRQYSLLDKNKSGYTHKKNSDLMIVMDDCLNSRTDLNTDAMTELFFNNKHHEISFIMSQQYPFGMRPEYRGNIDYVFLFREDNDSYIKRIYEYYGYIFSDFATFKQIFLDITENYGCLVINNRDNSNDYRKKVFWYRAQETPEFKFGK